ncbi:UNVERIFIED_CONTAM: Transcription factor [Sesamum latifolium]|uniref:Transcription factor n=1 Tax=Sesamum latifolium TaxID=2727402 RepID=A0AAW2UVI4_9LAMI
MKKKVNNSTDASNGEVPKQKERHIVSWSQEEDDILREQIRWFTYLNSDFKRGGWSPEEDMLLCEAQKIFGNRWTEIAKVVSGRTDNAVKNRFTTLCKKGAKREALAKENNTISYINLNNKRVVFPNGLNIGVGSESAPPLKKIRAYISNTTESQEDKLAGECAIADHLLRAPFAVLAQNVHGCKVNLPTLPHGSQIKEASTDGSESDRTQGTFLRKDDPKLLALVQQAELLSSLAIKVNSEKTDQSLESAWLAVQDFLKQNKESDLLTCGNPDTDFRFEKFKELVEDLRSSNEGSRPSWREPDLYESSPASSEYSTGSTQLSNVPSDKSEECQAEICVPHQETGLQSDQLDNQKGLAEGHGMCHTANTKNEGKALPHENTRNGVNFPKPNHQSFPTSTVQEVPPPLSVTGLMPVQNLQPSGVFVKCRAFLYSFWGSFVLGLQQSRPEFFQNRPAKICFRI